MSLSMQRILCYTTLGKIVQDQAVMAGQVGLWGLWFFRLSHSCLAFRFPLSGNHHPRANLTHSTKSVACPQICSSDFLWFLFQSPPPFFHESIPQWTEVSFFWSNAEFSLYLGKIVFSSWWETWVKGRPPAGWNTWLNLEGKPREHVTNVTNRLGDHKFLFSFPSILQFPVLYNPKIRSCTQLM